jgi:multicomponent Na+:H+ antiporter subunit A
MLLMFAIGFAVALKPFAGPERDLPKHAHEGPMMLWLGPLVLAVAGVATALFSASTHAFISTPMASAVRGFATTISISLVPHIGMALFLSLFTVAVGVLIYRSMDGLRERVAGTLAAIGWGPDHGFDQAMRGLIRLAERVTSFVHSGRLDYYMGVTFAAVALTLLTPMWLAGEWPAMPAAPDLRFYEWAVIAIAVIGLGAVLRASNRLTAIVSLGIQGFAVALIFMLIGAPDLSFTQFMVETLSVVILALVMTRLKLTPSDHRPTGERLLDGTIAIACGLGFGLLLMRITQATFDASLSEFFATHSRVIAHGRNIVNVIIVDFRGLDTLGEIAVVMITGLVILALVRIRPRPESTAGADR